MPILSLAIPRILHKNSLTYNEIAPLFFRGFLPTELLRAFDQ